MTRKRIERFFWFMFLFTLALGIGMTHCVANGIEAVVR